MSPAGRAGGLRSAPKFGAGGGADPLDQAAGQVNGLLSAAPALTWGVLAACIEPIG